MIRLLTILLTPVALAMTLAWDPSPSESSGQVSGYRLYIWSVAKTGRGTPISTNDVGLTNQWSFAPTNGMQVVTCRAVGTNGIESRDSNPVWFWVDDHGRDHTNHFRAGIR